MAAGPTYEKIQTQTTSSLVTRVDFNTIPQTYTDLILIINVAANSGPDDIRLRFGYSNGTIDSGSNYDGEIMYSSGTADSGVLTTNATSILGTYYGGPNTTLGDSMQTYQIMSYTSTNKFKSLIIKNTNTTLGIDQGVGVWRSNNAITDIQVAMGNNFPGINFKIGSVLTLYGIKAA